MDGRFLSAAVLALSLSGVFLAMLLLGGATGLNLPLPDQSVWVLAALGVVNLVLAAAAAPGEGEEPGPQWGTPLALASLPVGAVLLVVFGLVAWGLTIHPPGPSMEELMAEDERLRREAIERTARRDRRRATRR